MAGKWRNKSAASSTTTPSMRMEIEVVFTWLVTQLTTHTHSDTLELSELWSQDRKVFAEKGMGCYYDGSTVKTMLVLGRNKRDDSLQERLWRMAQY